MTSTTASDLNVLKALRNSLPFCAQFIKQYWILFIVYLLIAFIPETIFKDQNWNITKWVISCISSIVFYVIYYYAVKMATALLDSNTQLPNKSLYKTLWQLLWLLSIVVTAAIPLFLLFLVPGIWWITNTYIASIDIVNTDSTGAFESIGKSFQMTKGKFWPCLGFILGTVLIPIVIILIGGAPIAFFLHSTMLHDWTMASITNLVNIIPGAIGGIISCFCQTWLYIYLKYNNQSSMPS